MNIKITSKDGLTLKTKGKYVREDISVAVDESLMGGNIEIPPVSNLVVNEGVVSWTAPDITDLAEYTPTISYIVNINGNELETSNTSCYIDSYYIDGTNIISVKVKLLLKKYSDTTNTIVEY